MQRSRIINGIGLTSANAEAEVQGSIDWLVTNGFTEGIVFEPLSDAHERLGTLVGHDAARPTYDRPTSPDGDGPDAPPSATDLQEVPR